VTPAPAAPAPAAATPAPTPPAPSATQPGAKATTAEEEEEPATTAGCTDPGLKSRKPGAQEVRFFPMPEDRVKAALMAALKTLKFTIHKDQGDDIEASRKREVVMSEGETLHLEAATENGKAGTRVTAATRKKKATQKSWSAAILAQTACNLK